MFDPKSATPPLNDSTAHIIQREAKDAFVLELLKMLEDNAPDEKGKLECCIMARSMKIQQAVNRIHCFAKPDCETTSVKQKRDAVKALDEALETLSAFLESHEFPKI